MRKIKYLFLIFIIGVIIAITLLHHNKYNNQIDLLCNDFESIEGEISCKQAVNNILKKYPGKIDNINREKIKTSLFENNTADVWLAKIKLKKPIKLPFNPNITTNEIIVSIERQTNEIKIHGYIAQIDAFKKLQDNITMLVNKTNTMPSS